MNTFITLIGGAIGGGILAFLFCYFVPYVIDCRKLQKIKQELEADNTSFQELISHCEQQYDELQRQYLQCSIELDTLKTQRNEASNDFAALNLAIRQKQSDINQKQLELEQLQTNISTHQNVVATLQQTADNLRLNAEEQAKQQAELAFERKNTELQQQYEQKQEELKTQLSDCEKQLQQEQSKLDSLRAKQEAYNQAQLRAEAISANQDFYCLALDEFTLNDIKLLRDLQAHFVKKEAIDKLIWETYYKPAYDTLMGHLGLTASQKVTGIYKITDTTTNQAYIGQSADIRERFRTHIKAALAYGPVTNKLYQAMKKSGLNNFTFEILEQVTRAELNEREVYWIEFYQTKEQGMNVTRGGA